MITGFHLVSITISIISYWVYCPWEFMQCRLAATLIFESELLIFRFNKEEGGHNSPFHKPNKFSIYKSSNQAIAK